ncbi:hypothetical protein B296_00020088 [Ensete ventricosum]|uniref:Uncharacterized protein n=1 Tax=Ensete ventricosum TaxID=4639 RepID=A0A427A6V7_ENSVE|nr:hypothetical protein B296_00020088 [Ensete ventricosum]
MAAKRFESEGSSDDGGRRGQQQRRLQLCCDFMAASGVGCSKGAGAIGGRWAVVCTAIAKEGSNEDDSRLMDLRLGGRRWMKVTSKAIIGIVWKMEATEMTTRQ